MNDEQRHRSNAEKLQTLKELKEELIDVTQQHQVQKIVLQAEQANFDADHKGIIDDVAELKAHVQATEEELRLAIIEFYQETGNRTPSEHVGVRMNKKVFYDEEQAFDWGISTGKAISFNAREFEKIAKDDPFAFDFVIIEEVPVATISKKMYE